MATHEDKPMFAQIDVEKAFGTSFGKHKNINVFCPFHEDESQSKSPSCSISQDGVFNCKVCKAKGSAAKFYGCVQGITEEEAYKQLTMTPAQVRHQAIARGKSKTAAVYGALDEQLVRRCYDTLMRSSIQLGYLLSQRGLSLEIVKQYSIGCDENRITIPVRDEHGVLVNIRRYLRNAGTSPKMVSHQLGDGSPRLWPESVLSKLAPGDELIICEGEWDCLLLLQNGFSAVTVTSGVTTWKESWTQLLQPYRCVFIYDVNDKESPGVPADLGQRVSRQRCQDFVSFGGAAKSVRLPLDIQGGDITDWFVNQHRGTDELRDLIDATPWYNKTMEEAEGLTTKLVTLYDAAKAEYFYKPIRMRCLVAGKGNAPYILPQKVLCEVDDEDNQQTYEKEFDVWDGSLLSLVDVSQSAQKKIIKSLLGIEPKLKCSIQVLNTVNIEELFLIPAIDRTVESGSYTLRRAFYVGHGLQTNRVYEFEGYTLPHPETQIATHILVNAKPAESDIDSFQLTKGSYEQLVKLFHTDQSVSDRLEDIAKDFSTHVTKVLGRSDLHTAVDLAYHSALSFRFDGEYIHKGWIEILILGDTRTGKGFVAEGLTRFYGVGEVVNGEMVTIAGLVGGIQQLGDRITLTWGKIPLNDRRLVVIDESGSLSPADISRLSRVRSEGVAEITKILTEKTTSRTRLIWLANPRLPAGSKPLLLADLYNYGIEAVPELIGAAEDIARFDYVLITAQNEVSSKIINTKRKHKGEPKYPKELCQELLLWVWSRKTDQIVFEPGVVDLILSASQDLGRTFSAKFALIQAEDVRYKLARIAVAAAGRLFSTKDGQTILVTKEHAEFAFNFLHEIYSKPACGYAQLSAADREASTLRDPKAVRKILEQADERIMDLIDGLMVHRQLTIRDMCDYSDLDRFQAQSIISDLVKQRAIVKDYTWYVKRPAFKTFLQQLKSELAKDNHTTIGDDEDGQ